MADLRKDFERAAAGKPEAASVPARPPAPRLEYEMKGPLGDAARRQAALETETLRRAEKLRAAGLQKQAKERESTAVNDAKKSGSTNDFRKAGEIAQQGVKASGAAKEAQDRERALSRAQKVREFAQNAQEMVRSKEHEK